MAKESSFDIVSEVDMAEVDNALNQADKEVSNRFDFKGSNSVIERKEGVIHLDTTDDMKMRNMVEIIEGKLTKRGISIKALEYGKVEPSAKGRVKQDLTLKVGLSKEQAKKITTLIKDQKLKVQASIQGDAVRVTGKSKDDLQGAIAAIKAQDLDFPVQFNNYR